MSLQVWLPLNGTLENLGLDTSIKIGSGTGTAQFSNDGKIGSQSLKINNYYLGFYRLDSIVNRKQLSCSFWAKFEPNTTNTTFNDIITFRVSNDSGSTSEYRCEISNTGSWIRWYGNNYVTAGAGESGFNTTPGVWYHMSMVVDGTKIYTYQNGMLVNTYIIPSNYVYKFTGDFKIGDVAETHVLLNDIRIYDHCLSPKEVKEISKGLVLHYRLSGNEQPNLITGNFSCTSTKTEYKSSGSVGCVVTAADLLANRGKTLILSYDVYSMGNYTQNTAGTWQAERFGIHGSVKYTTTGSTISTQAYPLADLLTRGKSGRVSATWTVPTNVTSFDSDLTFSIQTNGRDGYAYPASTNNETWYLRNVKLEWGNKSTAWCPNATDPLYTAMGYNIEWDCGIANSFDGTKVGNITNDTDTPRYSSSYKFNSTTVDSTSNTITGAAYIVGPCTMPATQNITVAWWDKITKYGRGGIFETTAVTSDFVNGADYNTTAFANWDATFGIYNGSTRVNFWSQIKVDSLWHHYTITYDGANAIFYRDGVQVQKSALTGNLPAFNGIKIGIGKAGGVYRQINKNTSDFRIYATTLSADDIAELYHTAAIIDNQNNMYAYEYVEEEAHA